MKLSIAGLPLFLLLATCTFVSGQEPVSQSDHIREARKLVAQAVLLEAANAPESAIAKYKEVLEIEPKDFETLTAIAGLYGLIGQPVEEVAWAQKAIDATPSYWKAYINLGNGYAMQEKYGPAVKAFATAAEIAPKEPLPLYSLGVVAENQREIKKALEFYNRSVELDPKFENGLFSAAAMYANLKHFAQAQALLQKILDMNPNAQDARIMLKRMEAAKP